MKTNKLRIITCTVLVFCLCNVSCLNEDPRDQIPIDKTQQSLKSLYINYVASLYTYIGGHKDSQGLQGTTRGIYDFNTLTTDEAMIPVRGGDWYDGGFWKDLYLHTWGVNNQSLKAVWEYLYKVVILSNSSIEVLEANREKFDQHQIDCYIAEVRAFRAVYYYYLLDLFARVPLTTSSTIPIKEVKQRERKEVFDFVVKELTEAAPDLYKGYSNQLGEYYGRITQPVAHFILAKLYLNAEVYANNNWTDGSVLNGRSMRFTIEGQAYNAWEATVYYCDRIGEPGYQLSANYEDNFEVFNESSVENIFTIPMDKRSYTNQMQYLFRSLHYNHSQALGMAGENGTSATIDALTIYGYGTDNEDPRFDKNYYAGVVYDLNGKIIKTDLGKTLEYLPWDIKLDLSDSPHLKMAGARMKKYAIDKTSIKDGKLIDNDIVLFRYADVLLMKSEAKVRNGEQGDVELNEVRNRVEAAPRKANLENILDERLLELAWEGWRRQDLIRFDRYHKAYDQRPQLENELNRYTTVFPIPQSVLDLNTNLTQNYGY